MCQMPSWMTSRSHFVQGLLKKWSKGTIYTLGSLPPWTLQADRTSSNVGLNTRQRARFDAVAHTCVAWWHLAGTGGFGHPKLLIEVY